MIGFIGGTGNQGSALARRIALAGENVILGSRSREKAERVVSKIKDESPAISLRAGVNEEAAEARKIVFVTLPYKTMAQTLKPLNDSLMGKIIVDVVNPLIGRGLRPHSSASEELQRLLPGSKIVCAFKNISSIMLKDTDRPIEGDSIVCSDDEGAKKAVMELSSRIGVPAVDGGGLENALASELLTKLLLDMNKRFNVETSVKIIMDRP